MNDTFAEQCVGIGDVGPGGDTERTLLVGAWCFQSRQSLRSSKDEEVDRADSAGEACDGVHFFLVVGNSVNEG